MLNKHFISRLSFWAAIATSLPLLFPLLLLGAVSCLAFLLPLGCCAILPFIVLRKVFLSLQCHQSSAATGNGSIVDSDGWSVVEPGDKWHQADGSPEEFPCAEQGTVARDILSGERNLSSIVSPIRGSEPETRHSQQPHFGHERSPSRSILSTREREESDGEHAKEHDESRELEPALDFNSMHAADTEPYTTENSFEDANVQNSCDSHDLVYSEDIVAEIVGEKGGIMELRAPQACKQDLINSEGTKEKGVSDFGDGQHERKYQTVDANISSVEDVVCHFKPNKVALEEKYVVIPTTTAICSDRDVDENQTSTPVTDMEENQTSSSPTSANASVYPILLGFVEDDGPSSSDTLATNFDEDSSRSDYESATMEDCFEDLQVMDEEKAKMHRELDAIKKIVGCSGDSDMSLTDQIEAVYVFTGMNPPVSIQEVDDLEKARKELELLKLVIGVK